MKIGLRAMNAAPGNNPTPGQGFASSLRKSATTCPNVSSAWRQCCPPQQFQTRHFPLQDVKGVVLPEVGGQGCFRHVFSNLSQSVVASQVGQRTHRSFRLRRVRRPRRRQLRKNARKLLPLPSSVSGDDPYVHGLGHESLRALKRYGLIRFPISPGASHCDLIFARTAETDPLVELDQHGERFPRSILPPRQRPARVPSVNLRDRCSSAFIAAQFWFTKAFALPALYLQLLTRPRRCRPLAAVLLLKRAPGEPRRSLTEPNNEPRNEPIAGPQP
jgi:hypothetical protein